MTRETWGTRTGFVLAAAGSAVGLGNIWKFPYLAAKYGGGAFLFAYLIIVYVLIKSIMLSEIAVGRAAQRNPVGAFAFLKNNRWKIVGFFGVIAGFMILSFYSVVAGWAIYYVGEMASGSLNGLGADTLNKMFGAFITDYRSPIIYHAIFTIAMIYVVMRGVNNGIEKLAKFAMPVLLVLILVLVVRSLTLPGAQEGLEFYILPKWSALKSYELWSEALGQAFFSMSLGMGVMLTYGSYLKKQEHLPRVSVFVSYIDTGVAFLSGLLILPAMFALGFSNTAGPGLTFVTLPAIFNKIWGGQFFGTLFFVLLVFAAITSAISILEVLVSYGMEQRGYSRRKATIVFGLITFAVGVGCSYSLGPWSHITIANIFGFTSEFKPFNKGLFDLLDYISSNLLLPLSGMLIAIFVGWVHPKKMLKEITNDGTIDFWWKSVFFMVTRFLTPLAVGYILLYTTGILKP